MSKIVSKLSKTIDSIISQEGNTGYLLIIALVVLGYYLTTANMASQKHVVGAKNKSNDKKVEEEEDETPEPLRNFTAAQLRHFDGTKENDTLKPIYLSVQGIVFDVSSGRDFYGPGGPYEAFAGRECGVALAKMSFDTQHLDDLEGCKTLNFGEKTELEGWIDKFKYYRSYPIKGNLVSDKTLPSSDKTITIEELSKHTGSGDDIPEGYAAAPIYVGASTKVFDMSFGGITFYGPDGPYSKFAGHDVTRALALMSLDDKDINNPDISDITEKQEKTLNDWIKTFEERKMYPIVGKLEK